MTKTYHSTGKWILAGEHSVLRGSHALVFPLPSLGLSLTYQDSSSDLVAQFSGLTGESYQLLFYGLVDKALDILGRPRGSIKGSVQLKSTLPLGNGLGASAALCSVVGLWFADLGWVDRAKLEPFCRELENLFHGESSGVDVAVVLSGKPLYFSRFGNSEFLNITWKPHLYLSPSGEKGLTHICVQKVKDLIQTNPVLGHKIDEKMSDAVEKLKTLITNNNPTNNLNRDEFVIVLNQAQQCFQEWGLVDGALEREMKHILSLGALATKPTGSGAGGYVLSLWSEKPSSEIIDQGQLISCW